MGIEVALEVGHSGIFEVAVDGVVVARRSALRFPTEDEIVKAVAAALGR